MGLAKGLKKVSSKTLLRLGGTVTIKRTTNSSYNDTTGEVIKDETSINVKGNLENVSSVEVNDLVSQEDKKLSISAEGLTFTPTTKDKVIISSIEYKIVRVDTNEQDNTAIYYDLFLRA
tara:strand:+ start:13378 stop:13734 length:357 start_codon:yes stop_codon:yes gene_type:complete